MKKILIISLLAFFVSALPAPGQNDRIRVLIITGGHDYARESFNAMFSSMENQLTFQITEFPEAFEMFKPENRDKYDVLVFYHMWQTITDEQEKDLAQCISNGKPLVVLHHSICAFDNWPGYTDIIGGKYFHKPAIINGRQYAPSSYIHDLHFKIKIKDKKQPVTKGLKDFEVFDETYHGYYVEPGVTSILETDEPSSTPVIGWTKTYGKARVVSIQSGHDTPTFENPNYRKLLLQAIEWVYNKK